MLKIRLKRIGKRNNAQFRLVVTQDTSSPRGRDIEILGFLDPKSKKRGAKEERVQYWISQGAQTTRSAHNLLISAGILAGKKKPISIRKKSKSKKGAEGAGSKESAAETKPGPVQGADKQNEGS